MERQLTTIGRYVIKDQLGQGQWGKVYRAYDPELDRFIALKHISLADQAQYERFRREAQTMAALSHPHIVPIHDIIQTGNVVCIIMELLTGGTLHQRSLPFPWQKGVSLLLPLCDALTYAHQQKIVHRDIKPQNILFSGSGIIKLVDFGLAYVVGASRLTKNGGVVGTPSYAAPEQLRGELVDGRADVFALAMVLYEILVGHPPFTGGGLAVIYQIIQDKPVDLLPLQEIVPSSLLESLTWALVKNPAARCTAGEFGAALRRCLDEVTYPGFSPARISETHGADLIRTDLSPISSELQVFHNLPSRGEFVGRETEKARVHEGLLSPWRLVSIDGIGGIGKTSLALEMTRECLHASQGKRSTNDVAIFDGFIWTTARDRDLTLNDILDTIALTLEYSGVVEKPPEEKSNTVYKLLQSKPYLLIVDNFETITDERVRDFLFRLPEPSKSLITTREFESSGAWMISLKDLKEAEALTLIRREGKRLGLAAVEHADDQVLLRLYRATRGVPLAIKWAIGQIREKRQSLDRVLAALDTGSASIFDTIFARSWKLLSADAQRVILVMPLFAAPASRAAIEAISDVHDTALGEALVQLVSMSLVDATEELLDPRYSIHPLTRTFITATHKRDPEWIPQFVQAAFERMLTYYKQLVTPPKDVQIGVPYWDGLRNYANIGSLKREWPSLNQLIRRTLDEGRDREALDLFLPIVHLLNMCGLWDERLQLGREMCAAANRLGDSSEAWLLIDGIGWILKQRRQFQENIEVLDKGRQAAHRFDLTEALIWAEACEARLYAAKGNHSSAHQRLELILEQVELDSVLECGNLVHQIVVGRILGTAGGLSTLEKDFVRAKEWIERELELRNSIGEYVGPVLARLGYIHIMLGEIAPAEKCLDQALTSAGPKDKASINYSRALVAEKKGELREAWRLCELALEQYTLLGMKSRIQECQELLVKLSQSTNC